MKNVSGQAQESPRMVWRDLFRRQLINPGQAFPEEGSFNMVNIILENYARN